MNFEEAREDCGDGTKSVYIGELKFYNKELG